MRCRYRYSSLLSRLALCCAALVSAAAGATAQKTAWSEAEQLLLRGNYQESSGAYKKLREQFPIQAALGLSRCLWEQGKQDSSVAQLEQQLEQTPSSVPLLTQHAWIALQVGDFDTCHKRVKQTLTEEPSNIQARWMQAELWRLEGKIDEACAAYRELAEVYDQLDKSSPSPRQLYWLGQALAQHARFNQDKQRFQQLTTQLYPRLLSLEPNFWPAHCQTGLLLLEKFNASDAETAFNDALQINPHAADIQVGLARLALDEFQLEPARRRLQRALRTNPKHRGALQSLADIEFASLRPAEALLHLQACRALNPSDPQTLGRLAAAHKLLETANGSEHRVALGKVQQASIARSTSAGEDYAAASAAMELARRYPQASALLQRSIDVLPQLHGTCGRLGMLEMRLGHESIARRWLEESFEQDPYNVRVKNQLEVLDLLEDYTTLETEHFVIRFDASHDEALGRHMARYAEQCYDELSTTFDFDFPERALLEVFSDGRGVKAREWFGARMVGLPNIHTIAACGGNVVAMVSPTAVRGNINWADVLRHEIVHLFNIQQTNYAVPHWLTEGCAVWQENRPRRLRWEKLLVRRVPTGDVFDLQSLNLGFLRPRSADDWQLAYCQAEIYVELIADQYGIEGIRKLLAAYRDNRPTDEAISKGLGTTREQLETTNAEILRNELATLSTRHDLQEPPKLAEITTRWQQNPDDLALSGELALVRLRRGDYPGAGRLAERVLVQQPNQPLASYVKAKLLLRIGDEASALSVLQAAGKPTAETSSYESESLKLLASIHLQQSNWDEARRLYLLGEKQCPTDLQWTKALAVVAIRQQDTKELNRLLTRIAHAEPDNLVARKKLLQLAQRSKNRKETIAWANEVLHIDPNNQAAEIALQSFAP